MAPDQPLNHLETPSVVLCQQYNVISIVGKEWITSIHSLHYVCANNLIILGIISIKTRNVSCRIFIATVMTSFRYDVGASPWTSWYCKISTTITSAIRLIFWHFQSHMYSKQSSAQKHNHSPESTQDLQLHGTMEPEFVNHPLHSCCSDQSYTKRKNNGQSRNSRRQAIDE